MSSSFLWLRGDIMWPKGTKTARGVLRTPAIVPPKTFNGESLHDCLLKGWFLKDAGQDTINPSAFAASSSLTVLESDLVMHKCLKPGGGMHARLRKLWACRKASRVVSLKLKRRQLKYTKAAGRCYCLSRYLCSSVSFHCLRS